MSEIPTNGVRGDFVFSIFLLVSLVVHHSLYFCHPCESEDPSDPSPPATPI